MRVLPSERGVDVWEDLKDLVVAGDIENVLKAFVHAGELEFAAVFLDILHSFNEDGKAGAVEIGGLGKIDNNDFRLLGNHRTQRFRDLRRNVEVDLALERQNIWLFFSWHRTRNWRCLSHFHPSNRRSITNRAYQLDG